MSGNNKRGKNKKQDLADRTKGTNAGSSVRGIRTVENGNPLSNKEVIQAIIDDNAKDDKEKKSKDFLYNRGFRTEFGKNVKPGFAETQVETNYLEITSRPRTIYVYNITMTHEYKKMKPDGSNEVVEAPITRRIQKQGIFNAIKAKTARFTEQEAWATDFDLIWSVAPLFDEKSAKAVPPPYGAVSGVEPITGKVVTAKQVEITFDRELDLSKSVAKLYRVEPTSKPANDQASASTSADTVTAVDTAAAAADADKNADHSLLERGINAFISKYPKADDTLTSTNANTFYRNDTAKNLDGNNLLKSLQGYFVSLRPGSQSLILNVNVKHSPFFQPEILSEWMKKCRKDGRTVGETSSCLKGKMVKVLIDQKCEIHAPNGIGVITMVGDHTHQKPRDWEDYPRDLNDLPINIGGKKGGEGVDATKFFPASQLQLCDNQPFRGTLTGDQTTVMLESACKLPKENRGLILDDGLNILGISEPTGVQKAAEFGLVVSQQLMKVPARLLNNPDPVYLSGKATKIQLAGWNLVNVRVYNSRKLSNLPVLDLRSLDKFKTEANLDKLEDVTRASFLALGICTEKFSLDWRRPSEIAETHTTKIGVDGLRDLVEQTMGKEDESGKMIVDTSKPVLVVIPDHNYDLYSTIKRLLECTLGIHSACASSAKLDGFGQPNNATDLTKGLRGAQTMSNIGLKFNLKTTGDNQRLAPVDLKDVLDSKTKPKTGGVPLKQGPSACKTIILGADVAHPTASAVPGCPSIASVVGTVDDNYVRFLGSMRLQRGRQEYIADLEDMVKERLLDWASKHGNQLPKAVVFYRDGVSESQYEVVRSMEIPKIKEAWKLANQIIKPADAAKSAAGSSKPSEPFLLTFVIVGKRHNTRFYAEQQSDTFESMVPKKGKAGKGMKEKENVVNWNVRPGMVVDKKITHPYSNDFFLQSHEPLKGTGRSAHYFVLTNQLKFSADELQKITHSLCYIYARATKGVSYCAPAYYADRLCDRGRAYLRPWLTNQDGLASEPGKDEVFEHFLDRMVEKIKNDPRWNPSNLDPSILKYGESRKNPWHANMDNVMFYL